MVMEKMKVSFIVRWNHVRILILKYQLVWLIIFYTEIVDIYPFFVIWRWILNQHSSYTGGDIANLRELKVDQIRQYHKEYYRPENLSIFVCGNWGNDDIAILQSLLSIEDSIVEKRIAQPPTPFERPWIHHDHLITEADPSHSVRIIVLLLL